jgi:hypothetical protein
LVVTVTAAAVAGSPLAISVPINTSAHTSAALVAAAIRTALAASSAITAAYAVSGESAQIILTRLAGFANDATLAISWPTTLTAAGTLASAVAGIVGVVLERTGGDSKDIYGNAISGITGINAVALFSAATSAASVTCSSLFGAVGAGNSAVAFGSAINPATTIVMTAAGVATVDFIVIGG